MPEREDLTDGQQRVYDAILGHAAETGQVPTLRDVMRRLGFKSPNGVVGHLKGLTRKGWLTLNPDTARGIEVPALAAAVKAAAEAERLTSPSGA